MVLGPYAMKPNIFLSGPTTQLISTKCITNSNKVYLNKLPKLLSSLQIVATADIAHNLVAYMCKMHVESCLPFSRFKVVVFNRINVEDIIDLTKVS